MLICVKCIQILNSKCVKKKKTLMFELYFLTLHSATYLLNLFSFLFFFSNNKEKCEWFQVNSSRAEGYGCLHSAATLLQQLIQTT